MLKMKQHQQILLECVKFMITVINNSPKKCLNAIHSIYI